MKRTLVFAILNLALVILAAVPAVGQTTYNLDIIWQKAKPETSVHWQGWGLAMAGGDLNGDGYADFVSAIDSLVSDYPQRYKFIIYIFNGNTTVSTNPSQIIVYDSIGGQFAFCIADFNKDGYGDLAVGDGGGLGVNDGKGQVNIHYGTGIDLPNEPDLVIGGYGSATATNFGCALSAGDINGDGIDDLVVGAPYYGEDYERGRVYIYYGDTLGLHAWPDIIINGHQEAGVYEFFGRYVSGKSDFNNDSYDDLVIGAPGNGAAGSNAGKVYVYHGGSPMDTSAKGWIYGEASYQRLAAYNVSSVPADTNGFASVGWFGTPDWPSTTGSFGRGKCYMIPGDNIGEITPHWTLTGNDLSDSALGYWSCSAGYADNDKLGDFVAGSGSPFRKGRAYLFLRRNMMKLQPDAYIEGRDGIGGSGDVLGAKVAYAGDVDSCGRDEFLVSNYYADSSNMIWLCKYTGPDGVTGEPEFRIQNSEFRIYQNSPNPFSQSTIIKYQLTQAGKTTLKIYNIQGQLVRVLVNEDKKVGSYEVQWNGRDNNNNAVSNGIYIYKLNMGEKSIAKKMTLIR